MEIRVSPEEITLHEDGTASWEANHTFPIGGTYMGRFKFRCSLTPLQTIEADRDYRDLLGKHPELATSAADGMAYALSQLRQRVLDAPPFWNDGQSRFPGGSIKDLEMLEIVLQAAATSEESFRKKLAERHKNAISKLKSYSEKALEEQENEEELLKS